MEESFVYEELDRKYPNGTAFFPSLLAYGSIICSSIFPAGLILIISKAEGQVLSTVWDALPFTEKAYVRQQCRKAVGIRRSFQAVCVDAGKHNILYDRRTRTVTWIDFEMMSRCDLNRVHNLDAPEMGLYFRTRICDKFRDG